MPQTLNGEAYGSALIRSARLATLTIASGAAVSDEFDFTQSTMLIVHMPAAWTAADIGFYVAHTSGGTFQPLYDDLGNIVMIDGPAVDRSYQAPPELAGARYVKLWSQNGAGVDVNQAAARSVPISLKA